MILRKRHKKRRENKPVKSLKNILTWKLVKKKHKKRAFDYPFKKELYLSQMKKKNKNELQQIKFEAEMKIYEKEHNENHWQLSAIISMFALMISGFSLLAGAKKTDASNSIYFASLSIILIAFIPYLLNAEQIRTDDNIVEIRGLKLKLECINECLIESNI